MKITILLTFLLSFTAFAEEKQFQCEASFGLKNKSKTLIEGTITSDTTLADVTHSIDGQVMTVASVLTVDRDLKILRSGFYQTLTNADQTFVFLMPEKMTELFQFQAIIHSKKAQTRLDCFIKD